MALRIALSGFVVLVVAMGIGRFAFTPQVPLMIAAGQLTLTSAGLVAAMNYLGYLVGAWDAMNQHHRPAAHAANHKAQQTMYQRVIRCGGKQRQRHSASNTGITGAVALTLLSAAADNALVHGLLRFVIGCMSGWSMVLIHRIPCAHQIAQIVHRRHQTCAGERELPGGNHQRHLRGKREAPDSHRYHQNHKSTERNSQRHDRSSC